MVRADIQIKLVGVFGFTMFLLQIHMELIEYVERFARLTFEAEIISLAI